MAELSPRAQDALWAMNVGEARADGVEELFGVLSSERNVAAERRRGFSAGSESESGSERQESNNGWEFHSRKFDRERKRGKGGDARIDVWKMGLAPSV